MKRTLSFSSSPPALLILAGTGLIAGTYGLVRLAYGLFLPDVQTALSMRDTAAGYISSGASLAYCVGALCGLTARARSRGLVIGAFTTASLGSVGMAAAPSLPVFAVSALLASTGAGLASPALVVVMERNVPGPGLDRAQATVNAGTGPGLVGAGLLALLLLPHWRLGLLVSAAATAFAGVGVLLLDRRTATDGRSPDLYAAAPDDSRTTSWVWALTVPAVAAAVLGATSAVVWTYGRTQLVTEGASGSASTLAWVALGLGATLTVATSRTLSRWHPGRAWMVSTLCVAAAIGVLGLMADRLAVAVVACVVFGWGFVAASSALIAWAGHLVPERTAPGTSLLFVSLVLGQSAGSAAAGSLAHSRGLTTVFVGAAVLTALAAGAGRVTPHRPRESSACARSTRCPCRSAWRRTSRSRPA